MVNNCTNINKMSNLHLSPLTIEHKQDHDINTTEGNYTNKFK
jgi:hypothetical protein